MTQIKNIIIFDLDGTLANIDHRMKYIEGGRRDWDEFFENCDKDMPIESICTLYRVLSKTDYSLRIWTGRSETVKDKTKKWLEKFDIDYDELRMRPEEDYRPDYELKKEWVQEVGKDRIKLVFEDRPQVIEMWREIDVRVVEVSQKD